MLRPALGWVYGRPQLFPLMIDLALWVVGLSLGATLEIVLFDGRLGWGLVVAVLVALFLQTILGYATGVYRHRWRVSSFDEVVALGAVWATTSTVLVIGSFVARKNGSELTTSMVSVGALITLCFYGALRAIWRRWWEQISRPDADGCRRTIVFGAGEGGAQIIHAMLLDNEGTYFPVALLDDDPFKRNREIDKVRVQGTRDDIATVAARTNADVLLIAVPSAPAALIHELSDLAIAAGLDALVLPSTSELVGQVNLADMRPPTVEDLLGRDPVEIDLEAVAGYIRGKRVLVTGAGGSIGSELSRQLLGFDPAELFLLDRDESALHGVQLSIEGRALLDSDMLIVADIRDRERVFEIFDRFRPDVVFHTAALKHLTLLENNPEEGMKTNTLGTKNLLDAALTFDVERFVNISTDKAADPTSVLGATKLAAERLTALAAEDSGLPFVSVRFGNVLGSRGSVVPTFLGQIEQGEPLTVTHPEVTRYFMTIPEAVRLVVQAGAIGDPGEVMILDMGEPVKIIDIANQLIASLSPGTKIEFTGLRPGEKMHEVLMSEAENGRTRQHPRIIHTPGRPLVPSEVMAISAGGLDVPPLVDIGADGSSERRYA